jgi:tripartite-type tricarboxylate transporter receptor subunit TctC
MPAADRPDARHKFHVRRLAQLLILLIFMFCICIVVFAPQDRPNDYPRKPIVWIVPWSPGGGYDTYSRAVARYLPKYLPHRRNIIIRNLPGAGGRRGSAALYRAKPDGYTIGILNPIGLIASDLVQRSEQYDLYRYTYLATCGRGIAGIYVVADSPFRSIEDLHQADRVKFATSGRGSGTWLWAMLIKGIFRVPVHFVSGYSGTSEYITALIRRDVDAFTIGFASPLIPYCRAEEIRPLLIFSRKPWELMPEAETLKGSGYEELEDFSNDRVIAGPPSMPAEIKDILQTALLQTLNDPDLLNWSKKTQNPLYIRDAESTLSAIKTSMELLEKYKAYLID